jgi:DNA-binding response OmpR family regulator
MARDSILIADDDVRARESLAALLERAGYEATQAATGDEAVRTALAEQPAVVILEVELPRISGYDVCRRLREAYGEALPILLVSGRRTEPLDRVAGLLIGADDYLVKPVTAMVLLPRITRALTRSKCAAGTGRARPPTA